MQTYETEHEGNVKAEETGSVNDENLDERWGGSRHYRPTFGLGVRYGVGTTPDAVNRAVRLGP